MRKLFRRLLPVLILLAAPAAWAESPLADKVPGDALAYVGWRGADELGPAYDKSHLKGIADALEVQTLLDTLLKQAAANNPDNTAAINLFTKAGNMVFKYPTAVYFGGVVDITAEKPVPKLAMIVKGGKIDSAVLAGQLQLVIDSDKNRKPDDPKPKAEAVGDYLLVTVGDSGDIKDRLSGATDHALKAPLSENKDFKAAEEKTAKDPALMFYVNTTGVLKLVDDAVAAKGPPDAKANWPKVADALGIDDLKYAAMAGKFDGADWSTNGFLAMGDRRAGLLSLFDNAPLTADAYKMIPKSATWAGAFRLNGDRILKEIRDAAGRVDDQAQRRIDTGLQGFTNFTGVDLQKDILANLGDEIVFYGTPDATGSSLKGFTLVCKAKDGAALEKAFGDLEAVVTNFAGRGDNAVKIAVETAGDLNIHTINWKTGGFAWTVQNNVWILGLSSERVQAAAKHIAKGEANITENPEYAAAVKKLGVDKFSSFSFSELAKTGPESYALLTEVINMVMTEIPNNKIQFKMPPYDKIKPNVNTSLMVAWADTDGFHVKSSEPFPSSGYLGGMGAAGMWMDKVALEARTSAVKTAGAANLRQIGTAVLVYAADNKDQLPTDLTKLLKNRTINPSVMVRDRSQLPPTWREMTGEEQAAWATEHADFVYVGKGKITDNTAETVLAYEKYAPGAAGKVNVLFGDGHVDAMTITDLEAAVKKQK